MELSISFTEEQLYDHFEKYVYLFSTRWSFAFLYDVCDDILNCDSLDDYVCKSYNRLFIQV